MAPTRSLVLKRVFRREPAAVFEAWRNAGLMARWFSAPGWSAAVTSEFRVGGTYRIEMRSPEGRGHVQFGEYLEIEDDAKLTFTWTCHEIGVTDSVVSVELRPLGGATEMVLRHTLPSDREIVRQHEEGWIRCLAQLEKVLEDPT